MAMLTGPEMEEKTLKVLKTTGKLDDESLKVIQQFYLDQMKPVVSEEQLAGLRGRYRVQGQV